MSDQKETKNSKGKSLIIAYFLWLVGGVAGLHHYYLGRDLHGFLWLCTLGGYFGFGWLRDVFHINEYVAEANEDQNYLKKIKEIVKKNKKPPFSTIRFTGMVLLAYYWSSLFHIAIPNDELAGINWKWLYLLSPFFCALGVWAVGNVGLQKGGMKTPVIAAYLTFPLQLFMDESTAFTLMVLAAAYAFDTYEKEWRPKTKSDRNCLRRIMILGAAYLLFCSMWASYFYFNAKITDQDGEEIPVREAFYHFIKSPVWKDLKNSLIETWNYAQQHGWMETWRQVVEMSDPYGENNAYKVLGLTSMASQSEINSKCRTLSVRYHPDKVKNEDEKTTAQEKFYEVQQACEILSSNRVKRRRKNKRSDQDGEL
ncbi:hypothetical protein V9T40_007115 [Parthenolecanium corni]|uniref:DnaJ homolog subfamily C member 22 n=1 Tax=Parthenolecanium corni TaxID=536013 RepID=A0AAN9TUQ1_9HEMI